MVIRSKVKASLKYGPICFHFGPNTGGSDTVERFSIIEESAAVGGSPAGASAHGTRFPAEMLRTLMLLENDSHTCTCQWDAVYMTWGG